MNATITRTDHKKDIDGICKILAQRAGQYDRDGGFAYENYDLLKNHKFFSAMVPESCGGGGISYREMCQMIRKMGSNCGSTALSFSMHQHLIAASCWKLKNKGQGSALLKKVAANQAVLVSTGARDWLASNGNMERVDGGYLFSAEKRFASGCPAGDIAITSAPFEHETEGRMVLHFPVSLKVPGVIIGNDWHVMGMRATGSQTITFQKVFIPEDKIVLQRPLGDFHPVWNVVLTVAMPLIMSAYLGIAEKAGEIAVRMGRKYQRNQLHIPYILGKINNQLVSAQVQWEEMQRLVNDFKFAPDRKATSKTLALKTNVSEACISCVQLAMEAVGGQGFYIKNDLERLFRDVQAAAFHPLPKWDQYAFSSELMVESSL